MVKVIQTITTILLFILLCIWAAGLMTDIKGHEITGYIWWYALSLLICGCITYSLTLISHILGGISMIITTIYAQIAPVVIWILLIKEWVQ